MKTFVVKTERKEVKETVVQARTSKEAKELVKKSGEGIVTARKVSNTVSDVVDLNV